MNVDEQTCPTTKNKVICGSLPPRMKRSARGIFLLPEPMRQELLPNPTLSIKAFTDFTLPSQYSNPTGELQTLSHFFSKESPHAVIDVKHFIAQLQHIPIPDFTTVRRLGEFGHKALLDGFKSVCYTHLSSSEDLSTACLPLWVITFWGEVNDIKATAAHRIQCRDWIKVQLKQKKSPERRQLAEQASIILTILPWGQKKPESLSSPHWLSDSEQNEMLELIQDRCLGSPDKSSQFRIENIFFAAKLLDAFNAGSDTYIHSSSFSWLRRLGDDLAQDGSTLITIVHLGTLSDTPHWVPLAIQRAKIQFGDSFLNGTSL